jgi:hypothetical protein
MVIDYRNKFQRCHKLLMEVCANRVEMANWILSYPPTNDESRLFYEEQIRQYRCYDL